MEIRPLLIQAYHRTSASLGSGVWRVMLPQLEGVVGKSGIDVEYPGPARDYAERFVAEVAEG